MSRTALITGASAGIGHQLARQFAAAGYDCLLVARSADKLAAVADEARKLGVNADPIVADLADPAAPRALFADVGNRGLAVDVLVNNAGFGALGDFVELDLRRQLDMIRVNVSALVELTHLFLPGMVARKSGGVLNLASTASFQPGPHMAVYYASKAFVLSFSDALAAELAGTGVTVTAACPGPTHSEFAARAKMDDSPAFRTGLIPVMTAENVAKIAYQAFAKGRRTVVPGLVNKLGVQSIRLGPRRLATAIAAKINRAK
jgi:short-subunit dehydrogenase